MPLLQNWRSHASAGPSTSATRYGNLWQLNGSWAVLESTDSSVVAAAGVLKNFTFTVQTAPGAGKSWTITLRKNGSDTAAVLTLADTNTTVTYTASDISVSAGDLFTLRSDPSGTPAAMGQHHFGWEWTPTTDGQSIYGKGYDTLSNSATQYNGLFCGATAWASSATNNTSVVATAGNLTNLYVSLSGSPGSGNNYQFAVYKNGTKQDGSGGTVDTRVTIADSATSGNASFTLGLSPGDTCYLEQIPTSTPTTRFATWSVAFVATDPTQAMICGFDGNAPSNTVTNYLQVQTQANWGTAETLATTQSISAVTPFTVSDLYVALTVAPGSSKNRVVDIRRNAASPSGTLSVTIADAATTGNDTTHSVALVQGDYWGVRTVPTGTPASTRISWGMAMAVNAASTSRGFVTLDPGAIGNRGWSGLIH